MLHHNVLADEVCPSEMQLFRHNSVCWLKNCTASHAIALMLVVVAVVGLTATLLCLARTVSWQPANPILLNKLCCHDA